MGELLRRALPERAPQLEQFNEYRSLMVDTVRSIGKGVRVTSRYPGTEFMIPGGMTEWSQPDKRGITYIEHDRQYSASYRSIGEVAGRLLVLETESWLSGNKEEYLTLRNMYKFAWDERGETTESTAINVEINSSSTVDVELLPRFAKDSLIMEIDRTSEPFRFVQQGFVDDAAFDYLLERTDSYQRDLLGHALAQAGEADRLAS